MPRSFVFAFAYYENPQQLQLQYDYIRKLPRSIRKHLHVRVADDCTADQQLRLVPPSASLGVASLEGYRVLEKKRWNWLICKNIGVHHSDTDWVLVTDIDHLVPAETWDRLMNGPGIDDRKIYRFRRKDWPDLTDYKEHPNTWAMSREMWNSVGGYDERFSGFYGSDGEFRDRCKANSKAIIVLSDYVIRVPREAVPDASTTTYGRKEAQDRAGVEAARARIAKEGGKPRQLMLPYEKVF